MNDQIETLQNDIAFLRALAEDGAGRQRYGGSVMLWAGVVFSLASLVCWGVQAGAIAAPAQWAIPAIWIGVTGMFFVGLAILKRGVGDQPLSVASRAWGAAWRSVGMTIFALLAATVAVCWRSGSGVPSLLMPSMVLGLYGLAWSVAATVSGKGWIKLVAAGSYAGAIAIGFVSTSRDVFAYYALALILLTAVPGYVLMRDDGRTQA